MTNPDKVKLSKLNKRRAYLAMSGVSILLVITSFLAVLVNTALSFLYAETPFLQSLQRLLVDIVRAFGVSTGVALAAVMDLFASGAIGEFFGMIASFISMVIPVLIYGKICGIGVDKSFGIRGKAVKNLFAVFALGQLFCSASAFMASGLYDFLVPPSYSDLPVYGSVSTPIAFVMNTIVTCIFVPVIEEFMFRGVVFSQLKKYGLTFGVVGSALLFGVAHSSPVQSVFAFTFGIFAGFLTAVTGNIKTGIIFHALNNFVTVLSSYVPTLLTEAQVMIFWCIYYILLVMLGFFGLYHLIKKNGLMDGYHKAELANDGVIEEKCGMFQLMCLPLLAYIGLYAFNFISMVM